jgi:hypothetical protein
VVLTAHSCGSHPRNSGAASNSLRKTPFVPKIVPSSGFVLIPKISLARPARCFRGRIIQDRIRRSVLKYVSDRKAAIPNHRNISPKPLSWIAPAAATLEKVAFGGRRALGSARWIYREDPAADVAVTESGR